MGFATYNQHGTVMFSIYALNWKCCVRCDQWEWKDHSLGNALRFTDIVYESHSFRLDGLNHVHHNINSSTESQKAASWTALTLHMDDNYNSLVTAI